MNSTTYRWLLASHIEQVKAYLQRLETELEKIDAAEAEVSRKQEREDRRRRFNVNAEAVEQAKDEMTAAELKYRRATATPDHPLDEPYPAQRLETALEQYDAAEAHDAENKSDTQQPPYRVGDPDPTLGAEPSLTCHESIPNDSGWHWYCTRQPGHTGDHVAGNGERVCAVWPQTPTNT